LVLSFAAGVRGWSPTNKAPRTGARTAAFRCAARAFGDAMHRCGRRAAAKRLSPVMPSRPVGRRRACASPFAPFARGCSRAGARTDARSSRHRAPSRSPRTVRLRRHHAGSSGRRQVRRPAMRPARQAGLVLVALVAPFTTGVPVPRRGSDLLGAAGRALARLEEA